MIPTAIHQTGRHKEPNPYIFNYLNIVFNIKFTSIMPFNIRKYGVSRKFLVMIMIKKTSNCRQEVRKAMHYNKNALLGSTEICNFSVKEKKKKEVPSSSENMA